MRINELLDTVSPWTMEKLPANHQLYTWGIDGEVYKLIAAEKPLGSKNWMVGFAMVPQDSSFPDSDMTNVGQEFKVFSTVIDIIINDIVSKIDPDSVSFAAENFDKGRQTNRARLYTRLINRYLPPNYTLDASHISDARTEFQIFKNASESSEDES